jgi:hypothetical protein
VDGVESEYSEWGGGCGVKMSKNKKKSLKFKNAIIVRDVR